MEEIIHVRAALLDEGWVDNVAIGISRAGDIVCIEKNVSDVSHTSNREYVDLVALPGMCNIHSHAFQRGFAGSTEFRTESKDSFWTWRNQMYNYVLTLEPSTIYSIAKLLYGEMLRAGYTWVGEFHYLHRCNGQSNESQALEICDALRLAAEETGIGLCLIPVLYQRGGFRDEQVGEGQHRFVLEESDFVDLVSACRKMSCNNDYRVGMALHSLRAVSSIVGNRVIREIRRAYADCPIHIHVAEQLAELTDCVRIHGVRPVAYLFESYDVDKNWCLIHATHSDTTEIDLIARSQSVVGLCPTTEANLGDGIFPAKRLRDAGGRIAIGSDSHCSIDVREELRWLEYGQRLMLHERAILGSENESVGRFLYQNCASAGGQALGVLTGKLAVGYRADLILVDPAHASIANASGDRLLDRYIFCNHGSPLRRVMVSGKWRL